MPRKIRELKADLRRAGFTELRGRAKGSHTFWTHPAGPVNATISGANGDDAQPYQERHVAEVLAAVRAQQNKEKDT